MRARSHTVRAHPRRTHTSRGAARIQACLPSDVARPWAEHWATVLSGGTPWTRPPPPPRPLVVDVAALAAPNFTYISAVERKVTEALSKCAGVLAGLPPASAPGGGAGGVDDPAEAAWHALFAAARRCVAVGVDGAEFVPPPAPARPRASAAGSGASKDAPTRGARAGGGGGSGGSAVIAVPSGAFAVAATQCFARMLVRRGRYVCACVCAQVRLCAYVRTRFFVVLVCCDQDELRRDVGTCVCELVTSFGRSRSAAFPACSRRCSAM